MSIRVIAGTVKGRKLKLVPGDNTRPIMDRVKESLFNIIGRKVYDSVWLDLFAGTGSVGIEALSRGAERALLTDNDLLAIQTIEENLKLTRFTNRATVRKIDAFTLLGQSPDQPYNFIYIAPPQYKQLWSQALTALDKNSGWLHPNGQAVVQIDPSEDAPLPFDHLILDDQRRYGNTALLFFRFKPV
ncbi:MAG: 16S rRNA (guanine(966)-N(2))-methyltransferase RsmD [Chloroflexota bacterium]